MNRDSYNAFAVGALLVFFFSTINSATAANLLVKLPYPKGQSLVVVQGYNTPPTHIKKDSFAIDVTKNGCDAYGESVVAAASGNVMMVEQDGYNGGYGTQVLIDHGNSIISRYAHLIPESIVVTEGEHVVRGQPIGMLGNTGLVAGAACNLHPGAHLHFAMYTKGSNGIFAAYNPEPISNYYNITAGNWYLSDNDEENDDSSSEDYNSVAIGIPTVISTTSSPLNISSTIYVPPLTHASSSSILTSTIPITIPTGGVSISLPVVSPLASINDPSVQTNSVSSSTSATNVNDPDATSTTTLTVTSSTSTSSTEVTSTIGIVATSTITTNTTTITSVTSSSQTTTQVIPPLISQPLHEVLSHISSNGAASYNLGSGFSGTMHSLTVIAQVSQPSFLGAAVAIDEFKDSQYKNLVQRFIIGDPYIFTAQMATTTFSDLSITLVPYHYYRLSINYQLNYPTLFLEGTNTTGTATFELFKIPVGRVVYTYTFMPFLDAEGVSTPYFLSAPLNAVSQNFIASSGGILESIDIFTGHISLGGGSPNDTTCSLSLADLDASSPSGPVQSDNSLSGNDCSGQLTFSFASSSPMIFPNHHYLWLFSVETASSSPQGNVPLYGTVTNTAGGSFSDNSLGSAFFIVNTASGTVFNNTSQ